MISGAASAGSYLRFTQVSAPRTLTTADALSATDAGTIEEPARPGIPVSALKAIDPSQLKIVSIKDLPEIRDLMATAWLNRQAANVAALGVPDNAPQNTYATVKVNGKVVATLYNGGSVAMTNAAAASVGDLNDPPGLKGGPDLAQWRAERIAEAVGGTVEKASTAITQPEWKPRESTSPSYTREQLDAAFDAMIAEQRGTAAQGSASYQAQREASRGLTDVSA